MATNAATQTVDDAGPMRPQAPSTRATSRLVRSWLIDIAILGAATFGTYFAAGQSRPVTAVLIYLTGVISIGARSGLYRGLAAALAASFIYNFFLSEPRFRLGFTSVDELVPLLAFNLSAFVSAVLAGRLRDAARAARTAQARNALLLAISDELQRAVSVEDVSTIARERIPRFGISLTHLSLGTPLSSSVSPHDQEVVAELQGSRGQIGCVTFRTGERSRSDEQLVDFKAIANLLAMAIDRCQLLEQLTESLAARRSEELKNALLSSVSHDFRTPLTAIEAAASSLRSFRSSLSSDQEDALLATITAQCEKLNRYTASLLDMSRIQAGIPSSQLSQTEVGEILAVALAAIRAQFPEQPIEKEVRSARILVTANGAMLEQVFFNVLENAVIHGGAGKPVKVLLEREEHVCTLSISDEGPGLNDVDASRIFERFYRGQGGAKREGSGLGLYIARGFIEAFGGSISLGNRSDHHSGATVTISLPLAQNAEGHSQ